MVAEMSNDMPSFESASHSYEFDFAATMRGAMRVICMLAGLVIIGLGVYCGWLLFSHIRSVITEGKPLDTAVDAVASVIHAEKIIVENPQQGVNMELGRSVAVGLVWMFYLPGMWIALGFIKAGASLISTAMFEGPRRR